MRIAAPTFTSVVHFAATSRVDNNKIYLKSTQYNRDKMAAYKIILAFTVFCAVVKAQRPFYAGLRPVGYPAAETNVLTNRFGEDKDLPIEAKGDGDLINRLDAMPVDKQPFWYLNWRQYAKERQNPQTYPIRPNVFANNQ